LGRSLEVLAASANCESFSRNFTRSTQWKSLSNFKMLSTENVVVKSLAPEITQGSALNLVSIHFIKSEIRVSTGNGVGRRPKSFTAFSYSLNRSSSLFLISEISFSEASLRLARALSSSWIFCSLLLRVLERPAMLILRSSAV
jgi:hypothetical protein